MYPSQFVTITERDGQFVACQTRTGAVAAVPSDMVRAFQSADGASALSLHDRIQLLRNGFLVKDPNRELEELVDDFKIRKKVPAALHLILVPGYACNCVCPTCFQKDFDKTSRMSPAVCDAIVEFARRRVAEIGHSAIVVWFYGGEPFVHTDICSSLQQGIHRVAKEFGIHDTYRITTNGTRLSAKDGCALASNLDHFYVSLSQSSTVQSTEVCYRGGGNSYGDVMRGLAFLAESKKDISLRINVSHLDTLETDVVTLFDDLAQCFQGNDYAKVHFEFHARSADGAHCIGNGKGVAKHTAKNKALRATIRDLIPLTGWPRERFHFPAENKLLSFCRGGCEIELCRFLRGIGFFIGPQGDMFMCNITENNPKYRLGNILQPDNALQHPTYLMATTKLVSDDPTCRQCSFLPLCMANCPLGVADCATATSRAACREKKKGEVEKYAWHAMQTIANNVTKG